MKAPCSSPECENVSPDGYIYCESCQPWVNKFGMLRGEKVATTVN